MSQRDWTDDQLFAEAQVGLKGGGPAVESMRRLRESIDRFSISSDRYSKRMLWLTVVLMVLTALQAIAVVPIILGWFHV